MSQDTIKPAASHENSPEFIRMYYEHQYDRMAKLEEQGMIITNVVITLTAVGFTFGFSNTQGLSAVAAIGLAAVLILANLFAIYYTMRISAWIRTHRSRAKRILEQYAPALYQLDKQAIVPDRGRIFGLSRRRIQIVLHTVLAFASALIPLIFFTR